VAGGFDCGRLNPLTPRQRSKPRRIELLLTFAPPSVHRLPPARPRLPRCKLDRSDGRLHRDTKRRRQRRDLSRASFSPRLPRAETNCETSIPMRVMIGAIQAENLHVKLVAIALNGIPNGSS